MRKNFHISLIGKNEIAREGLCKILSGENFNIKDSLAVIDPLWASGIAAAEDSDAHVIVIDKGHDGEGLDACRSLAIKDCGAKLVLLTDHYDFDEVALAFQSGVDAVIVKEISCGPLIESITLVAMGEKVFPSQLAEDLANCIPAADTGDWRSNAAEAGLSAREIEILETIMTGMANKVIARKFDICEATVKVHVKAILRKLGVDNRTQAATWGVKHSVSPPSYAAGYSAGSASMASDTIASFGQAA